MQHEIRDAGTLHDGRGALREPGWARKPLLVYDRSAIKASGFRIKEWDYYCVLTHDYGIGLTIADNAYMGFFSVSLLDLGTGEHLSKSAMTPFPMGSIGLPPGSESGVSEAKAAGMSMRFEARDGTRRVTASWADFSDGHDLSVDISLAEIPGGDSMVIATPFADDPRAFYYNRKVNCLRASGSVRLGDRSHLFEPATASGVLDWGRGVWTWINTWYWASLSGTSGGKPFGFNLGYGFGDTAAASENTVFFDGKAHKLDTVRFEFDPRDLMAPWRFLSNDGRFVAVMEPCLDRASRTDLLLLKSDQHQVFGHWSGSARLDDGSLIEFSDLPGFAEEVYNRW